MQPQLQLQLLKFITACFCFCLCATLVLAPASVYAQDAAYVDANIDTEAPAADTQLPSVDQNNPIEIIRFIVSAFKAGKWAWAVGLLFTLLTLLFRKLLKDKIPKKVTPWISIVLAVGTSLSMALASGTDWINAIGAGLTAGLAAIGGWEAFGKLFRKLFKPSEKE